MILRVKRSNPQNAVCVEGELLIGTGKHQDKAQILFTNNACDGIQFLSFKLNQSNAETLCW